MGLGVKEIIYQELLQETCSKSYHAPLRLTLYEGLNGITLQWEQEVIWART